MDEHTPSVLNISQTDSRWRIQHSRSQT